MDNNSTIKRMILIIDKILKYTQDLDYTAFTQNELLVESCAFNLSQIGELSHKLETDFQNIYKDIPWKAIYGLRNRIIHDYDGINLKIIWETIKEDLPTLCKQLKEITTPSA